MKTTLSAKRATIFARVALAFAIVVGAPIAARAQTPAGTSIVNQATSSYSDTANNTYTSTSNKVTTVVQNAPAVGVAPGAAQSTTAGGQLTDTFTLTNSGNANATFTLTAGAETGTDGTLATVQAYVVTLPATITGGAVTGCTILTTTSESCTTLTAANSLLANNPVAQAGVATVGVVYNVSQSAPTGTVALPQTVTTPISATATQAAGTGTTVATSNPATAASETDNVVTDARIDLQKFSYQPGVTPNTSGNIEYVIDAANGGSLPARDLQSVKTLLGGSAPAGVFISDKLPSFGGTNAAVQSASVAVSATNGFGASSTQALYYSTSATGAAGSWFAYTGTSALPTTATYIGVLISGTATAELGTNGNTTTTGVVPAAKAAVTLTFYVTPPSGTGSGNANAYVNQANGVIGGNQPNLTPDAAVTNPPQNAIGPAIPANTADSTTAIDSGMQGILFPTPAVAGPSTTADASNAVGNMATVGGAVLNGPFGNPGAVGSYNGVAPPSINNDNTAVAFTPANPPTNTSSTATPVGSTIGAIYTQPVANTLQNIGNSTDNITLVVTAPTGWGVQIYASSATGTQTGAVLAGSTTSNTATYTFMGVSSGATTDTANQVNYVVVYTVPAAAVTFNPYDVSLVATSGNLPTASNTTHDDIVPGGPIALAKSVAYDPATCTGGNAVPGCIMTYSIVYQNDVYPATACPATAPTASTIPAYLSGYYGKGLTITENGTAAPNTWGATYTYNGNTYPNTKGLNAPATDTTANASYTGNTTGSYNFSDLVGGSASYVIAPGCAGTLQFRVTVNTQ